MFTPWQVVVRAASQCALASLVGISFPLAAAPTLDASFGVNGIVERSLPGNRGEAGAVLAFPDGTLLAAGYFWHGYRGGFAGMRLYVGSLLEHYSVDGSQVIAPPPFFPALVQRDGKMVTISQTGLKRVNPDGTPDAGYVLDGATGIPWFATMFVGGLALQADGKVVVAGNTSHTVVLLRFNTDGSLDPTFNYIGALIVPHGDADIDLSTAGLVVQPDGKLVVAATSIFGQAYRFTLIRYNGDGSPDASFGNNGRASAAFGLGDYREVSRVLRQPNGRLLAIGHGFGGMQIVGFRPQDGVVDRTFGTAGVVMAAINAATESVFVNDAIVAPDGKLLVAFESEQTYRLMRFTLDGAPDATFGTSGTYTSLQLPIVTKIALQPDGDLALGGTASSGNFGLGRFISDPSTAIEFYNAPLNHYFMSMNPQEVAHLDLGTFSGWTRTGLSFLTYGSAASAVGTSANPVCRFYIPPQHGDSHFFSADPVECAIARDKITTDPNFSGYVEETPSAYYIGLPDKVTGACPAHTTPVYRLWNQGSASNHRYTTSVVVKNQMIANGWVAEGYGPNAVDMCAPQ